MAKRRKNRTHVKNPEGEADGTPKSFIIKHGQVGRSVAQLVRDMRQVMEPNTATRLRERSRNKLKDYLTLAPTLHVTHLLAFTLTPVAPMLRIVRLSAGPTLSFRIERYSLANDVAKATRRVRSAGLEYISAPLLVLASFPQPGPSTPPHLSLLMKSLQSLFPPLSPQSLSLSSARRIVLAAYNAERGTVDFRHYLITVKPYGVSKRVQRLVDGATKSSSKTKTTATGVLDLGNEQDVADFLLRKRGMPGPSSDGYESAASTASSVAGDDDAISLPGDFVGRNNKKGQKRAVRLDEIGPRMELRLIKVVEGLPGKEGGVIYHHFVKKTKAEVVKQKAEHSAKEKLRKERREEQERNVERKKEAKAGGKDVEDDDENGDEDASMGEDEEGEDDDVWDDDEEISEGELSEEDEDEESEEEEEVLPRPKKKAKVKQHR